MSVHVIYYKGRAKMMRPVLTREEYEALRNSQKNRRAVKQKMVQMNYSCLPGEDGLLKGCKTASTCVGADLDFDKEAENYEQLMEELPGRVLGMKDEIGLLMLERSATKGYHIVFKRQKNLTQEGNLRWLSEKLGVQYDEGAKDITRVFYTPADKLLYLDDDIFTIEAASDIEPPTNPTPPSATASLPSADSKYPEYYGSEKGAVPYRLIVECQQQLLGGEPAHGSRNNFIFTMAAHLRYVCDDDPEWIASILPTYGECADKWRRTIESACQRSQNCTMPALVKRAISLARQRTLSAAGDGEDVPPAMPKKLPKVIAHLVKNVPEVCRPAVANAVFPALGAHLKDVKFWLIDGTEKEATFMCVTMAKQSSGKSAVNKPIEYITADIVERDELSRKREQDWKDAMSQKGANKEKPKRPDDLCVQVLVSDMTNAAFVQRMKDAGGHYLYTNLEELDLLKQLQTNGTKDVGKIICLCFDNGKYGQERVGTQSVTARVDVRWNWNAASTIQKGLQFFGGRLVDGTLSRVNFCTIVPDKSKPFVYGRYDENYAKELKPFITNLNLANGHIECKQALELARRMQEKCQEDAALSDDDVLQDLAYRAVTIAYLKAMVLYICNDMTWSREIAEFAEWSLNYDLWCKNHFFGKQMKTDQDAENINQPPGRKNLLDLLPDTFSLQQAQVMRREQGMDDKALHMIRTWVYRGYVERDDLTLLYTKTNEYLKRCGQASQ